MEIYDKSFLFLITNRKKFILNNKMIFEKLHIFNLVTIIYEPCL